MGDFATNLSNVLFTDKSARPGVVLPDGWTNEQVARVGDLQAVKNGMLDLRTALYDVINARSYGVTCDGATNDYTTLTALLATVGARKVTLLIPGNCVVGTSITIPSTMLVRFEAGGSFSGAGVVTYTAWNDGNMVGVRTATTTPVTVTPADDLVITNMGAASAVTVNLPSTAATPTGTVIVVKDGKGDAGTNNITINRNGSQTIDGATSKVLATNYSTVALVFDGTNWRVIYSNASEPWVAPSLLNSWVNVGGQAAASYYRDAAGVVHIQGRISTGASGAIAFNLPAGFRPAGNLGFIAQASGGGAAVNIASSTGAVTPINLTGSAVATYCSLDGITFRAEA